MGRSGGGGGVIISVVPPLQSETEGGRVCLTPPSPNWISTLAPKVPFYSSSAQPPSPCVCVSLESKAAMNFRVSNRLPPPCTVFFQHQ